MNKLKGLKYLFLISAVIVFTNYAVAQQTISLAGKWKVALDQTDEGVLKRWYDGKLTNDINLPGTTDLAKMGIPEQTPWSNYLFRPHKFIGAAWYQKEIDIPLDWKGYNVDLLLERVLWESRVWVDGKENTMPDDGLTVAHTHSLGKLTPGRHLITVRVDNRLIHNIGDKGHNYTELTQSIWNGIAGRIELIRKGQVSIQLIRAFSDAAKKEVAIETTFLNSAKSAGKATLTIILRNSKDLVVGQLSKKIQLEVGENKLSTPVKTKEAALWSEFQQPLYTVQTIIESDGQKDVSEKITFGFRQIGVKGPYISVNNSPVFIRGNQDCLTFPLTGYPPTDLASWKRIFQLYKDYGFNQVRFHSGCPPDAAFQAADELGVYIMAEVIWITSRNGTAKDIRPSSITSGLPQGLGKNDRTLDSFVVKETKRILDQYGNHPSFCFFAYGNEMDNLNQKLVNEWVGTIKTYDPRRLYSGTTARMVLPNDDFQDSHVVPGAGYVVNNYAKTHTRWSYDSIYVKSKVPVIAHELGQVPVYPNWDELNKYTGPLKPVNLINAREKAVASNVVSQDKAFQKASGYLQKILYKEELETQFRSAHSAGFNMLAMNDYPGQGEALAGWFDSFWETKGTIEGQEFSQWNSTTVPLAQFDKYVWKGGESFSATIQLSYFGQLQITTGLKWSLTADDQQVIQKGEFNKASIQPGNLVNFGDIKVVLPSVTKATSFSLRVTVDQTGKYNEWKFWLFPQQQEETAPLSVTIVNRIDEALSALEEGKKVLLIANQLGNPLQRNLASFKTVFWSTVFFPNQGAQTLGAVIKDNHPALKYFPTADVLDRQWQELCSTGRGTILDDEANSIEPIVQPVDDFHSNRKLGSIFELKVGKGSLLICGYDIQSNLQKRPEAMQLRKSLLAYMDTSDFQPTKEVPVNWLRNKFYYIAPAKSSAPKEFSKAIFYTYAGIKASAGESKWEHTADQVITNSDDISWKVEAGNVYKSKASDQYGWMSRKDQPLKVHLGIPHTTLGAVFLKVKITDQLPHNIVVILEGRKTSFVVTKEQWLRVEFFREDFEDDALDLELQDVTDTGLLVSDLVIVPET